MLIFVPMSADLFDTTICAVASPGRGALSLIRLSGPDALVIIDQLFVPAGRKADWQLKKPNTLHYGYFGTKEETVDEVMVSVYRAPHSYTGEESIEISCHGSLYIEQRIMHLLIGKGASPARPGEFTQRAFMNGKMDLSQAEAVADLIASETEGAHRVALKQLRGGFSREISALRDQMIHFSSMIELELDFSEEDVEFADRAELTRIAGDARDLVDRLASSFKAGNAIKNGVPVAIVGAPNVGKSTLLNVLLRDDRAIVSEIAGTTRDSIEDTMVIDGVLYRFIDTAGIRETSDTIENMGIRRTYMKMDQASVIMLMAEASDSAEKIQNSLTSAIQQSGSSDKPLILIINKKDRVEESELNARLLALHLPEQVHPVALSASREENIDELTALLTRVVNLGQIRHQDTIITNIRHYHALQEASACLLRVLDGIEASVPGDLLAQDIREAIMILGEITGEVTNDEILANIFRNFCIGK